jgi:hypothetical protein
MASGGKRPGAGRPTLENPKDKKVQITVTIHPNTKIKIAALKEHGIKIGKIVDEAVNEVTRRWLYGEDLTNLK